MDNKNITINDTVPWFLWVIFVFCSGSIVSVPVCWFYSNPWMQHKDGGHMSRKWNSVWQPTDLMLREEVVVADEDLTVGGRDWMSDGTLLTLYTKTNFSWKAVRRSTVGRCLVKCFRLMVKSPLLIIFLSMLIFTSVRAAALMTTSVTQSCYTYESDEKPALC